MRRTAWQEPIAFWGASVVLVLAAVLPLSMLAATALTRSADLAALLTSGATWALFARSCLLSAAVAAIAIIVGVPLGFLLGRTDLRGRGAALALHAFPMFLPPFLLALGWFHWLGRQGLVGSAQTSQMLFSSAGAVFVLAMTLSPIVTTLTALGLSAVDPSLEEAGRVVARPFRVATRIVLPLAWPSAALGGLIVFALSFSELGVPMFLRVRTYPEAVFSRLGGISYAPGEAFALVVPLFLLALVLLALERRLFGSRSLRVFGLRRDRPPFTLGRLRAPLSIAVWLFVGVSLSPIASLVLRATQDGGFATVDEWLGASVRNSLLTAGGAATFVTVLGLVIGRALVRHQRAAAVFDAVAWLAFVMPAAALGAGIIAAWNRPVTSFLYASAAVIVLGYVARYLVIGIRPLAIAIGQGSIHLEDAAAVAGAGFFRRLARILIPFHARAIGATWLLVLVFCLRDLETAILYYPPGGEPLPVRIFTLEANGPEEIVAALAILHVGLTGVVVALGLLLFHRGAAS